jgi:hypothetical protein
MLTLNADAPDFHLDGVQTGTCAASIYVHSAVGG